MTSPPHKPGRGSAYYFKEKKCRCDECKAAVREARRRDNASERRRAKRNEYNKRWYAKQAPRLRAAARARVNPQQRSASQRRARYGVTPEQYDAMLLAQGGCCVICRRSFADGLKACVDHDHSTKRVRGVLCDDCNVGLGRFKDDEDRLVEAILYLRRSRQS